MLSSSFVNYHNLKIINYARKMACYHRSCISKGTIQLIGLYKSKPNIFSPAFSTANFDTANWVNLFFNSLAAVWEKKEKRL